MNPAESPGYPTSLTNTNFGSAVKPYGFTSDVIRYPTVNYYNEHSLYIKGG